MSDQYTPTGGQTIFPRINYLKTFNSRFEQRSDNGRIFLSGTGGGGDLFGDAALDLRLATSLSLTDAVSGNNLVTFSRASVGTYVGSDGLIKNSAINQFTHSDFGDSTWVPVNITKKSTNNPAPDGSNTAVLIGDSAPGPITTTYLSERLNLVGGGIQTFTSYAKGTTTGQGVFIDYYDGGANRARASISLDDGTVSYYVAATGDAIITSTDVGNGWWRCQLTLTPAGTTSYNWRIGNYASGDIYIWGAQLEPGSTASTLIPTTGVASGAPRFDHDPVTLQSLGLLIEESRTNLLTYSEQFDQGNWLTINSTITPDTIAAPDASITASTFNRNNTSTGNYLDSSSISKSSTSITYTWSLFFKKKDARYASLRLQGLYPSRADIVFDLDAGTVAVAAITNANFSNASGTIQAFNNGWFRASITATSDSHSTIRASAGCSTEPEEIDGPSSVVNSVYVWGAQVEAAATPSSYIPTSGSAVTRSLDIATIGGTNFSSWYNQSEGTVFVEAEAPGNSVIAGFDDGTVAERWRVGYGSNNNSVILVIDGGVTQTHRSSPNNSTPFNQFHKLAGAIAVNNLSFAYNGTVTSDSSLSVPVVNVLNLGKSTGTGGYINGHISRLSYFPTRKTDADLIKLTT